MADGLGAPQQWRSRALVALDVVIDKTGFTAPFNVLFDFGRASAAGVTLSGPPGPSIFTAVQEQLGLRLAPVEAPVEVLVIDRVERPPAD
jgi:uncharacterized protein (TIGR03435 family)